MPGAAAAAVSFQEPGFPGKATSGIVSQVQKRIGWGHLHKASITYSRPVLKQWVLGQPRSGNVWDPYQDAHKSQAWQNGLAQASTQRQAQVVGPQ